MFEYILYLLFFYCWEQVLFTLRFSLLLSLNDAFVDSVEDEGSFKFSPKAEFTSPLQQTLKQNHCASRNSISVQKANERTDFVFFKILFVNTFIQTIPCNFDFIGKLSHFHLQISRFSSVLLRRVSSSFFLLFSFLMKLSNQSVTHHLANYLKVLFAMYF